MSDEIEELGPVDIVVIGYPKGSPMTGEAIPYILDLVDRGIVRILDAIVVIKDEDGNVGGFRVEDLDDQAVGDFAAFAGANSGLVSDDDFTEVGTQLDPGEGAAVIVYENRWAAPFAAAVRRNGGRLIAFERVGAEDLAAAIALAEG